MLLTHLRRNILAMMQGIKSRKKCQPIIDIILVNMEMIIQPLRMFTYPLEIIIPHPNESKLHNYLQTHCVRFTINMLSGYRYNLRRKVFATIWDYRLKKWNICSKVIIADDYNITNWPIQSINDIHWIVALDELQWTYCWLIGIFIANCIIVVKQCLCQYVRVERKIPS